jgi:hypothetical protein
MAVQGPRGYADVNAVVGGYLRDLAFAQSSQHKMFGYKQAAAAILSLDMPLTDLLGPDGPLQLSYAETALAHVRLAAIRVDRIVNCWPMERLLAWLSDPSSECGR